MKGYKVILKRRKDRLKKNDLKNYEYLIFGHFDGMNLSFVNSWEDLSPASEENCNEEKIEWDFLDEFIIKGIHNLDENFFNISKTKLFVAISMLNLNEQIDIPDHLNLINNNLVESKDGCIIRVLPTLSYQDAVVLFLGNDLNEIKNKIEKLRSLRTDLNDQVLVTDIYTIVGINQKVYKTQKYNLTNSITISVRILLESGINIENFLFDFKKNNPLSITITKKHILDNSDIMFFLTGTQMDIFSLFMENGCFNPGNPFFKNNISHIRTSIHPISNLDIIYDTTNIQRYETKTIIEKQEKFQEFWGILRQFFKENDKDYLRLTRNLSDMYKLYLSLIQSGNNQQLATILTKTFDIFMANITININSFDKIKIEIYKELDTTECNKKKKNQKELFQNICETIRIFKEYLFSFLQDLRKSNRMFIEESSLTHPSVASATKLVLFYNQYINKLAEKLVSQEQRNSDDNRKYHFMIMSGGTNDISTLDLFAHMDPWDPQLCKLIFVLIPERQLFDMKKTLFSLSHECAHFCGKRYREKRKDEFLKSVIYFLSFDFEAFGKEAFIRYTEVLKLYLKRCYNEAQIKDIWSNIENSCSSYQEIYNAIYNEIKVTEGLADQEFFVELNPIISKSWNKISSNEIFKKNIYYKLLMMFEKFFLEFQDKFKTDNINSSLLLELDFELIRCNYFLNTKEELWHDLWKNVEFCFSELYKNDSFNDIIRLVSTSMKECYADIVAAKIQNTSAEEFIMFFVDDNLSLEKCFPTNLINEYRISLDLEIIFDEHKELKTATKENLKKLFKKKQDKGMACKFGCNELINHINNILKNFSLHHQESAAISPIKSYLTQINKEEFKELYIEHIFSKGEIGLLENVFNEIIVENKGDK